MGQRAKGHEGSYPPIQEAAFILGAVARLGVPMAAPGTRPFASPAAGKCLPPLSTFQSPTNVSQ